MRLKRLECMDTHACNELCTAILRQAVLDWVAVRCGTSIKNVSQQELLRFFKSKWAKALAGDIDPMHLIRQVEALLEDGVPRGGVIINK